jgi:hypothetical protein
VVTFAIIEMKIRNHGVFCLEGDWWGDFRKNDSMEPMLQLLWNSPERLRFVHRNVATRTELEHYLGVWARQKYKEYRLLYLGFHGSAGYIQIGDQRKADHKVDFEYLGDRLKGKCKGKVIHFSSCETLDWHGKLVNRFLRTTGACCVSGYQIEVNWISSAAFELFLFPKLQRSTLTKASLNQVEKDIKRDSGGLSSKLGFKLLINPDL